MTRKAVRMTMMGHALMACIEPLNRSNYIRNLNYAGVNWRLVTMFITDITEQQPFLLGPYWVMLMGAGKVPVMASRMVHCCPRLITAAFFMISRDLPSSQTTAKSVSQTARAPHGGTCYQMSANLPGISASPFCATILSAG